MGFGDTIRGWLDPPVAGGRTAPAHAAPADVGVDGVASDRARDVAGAGPATDVGEPAPTAPAAPSPKVALDPVVRRWLGRELPMLAAEGLLSPSQAAVLARRYGITTAAAHAPVDEVSAGAVALAAQPGTPAVQPGAMDGRATAAPTAPRAPKPSLVPFLSEHAVSIVLYLGAFLVVSSVFIFLAYAWELVGGAVKVAMVAGLAAGFLLGARLCLPRPSVRPAGRTFLALGAILVPATVAAAYTFLYADGPLPQALFWLFGALISGGLHAALSLRLESRAYGVLAALAPPVAVGALAALAELDEAWWLTAASIALALGIAAVRGRDRLALADGVRFVACAFLPVNALVSLAALSESGPERWSASAALLVMAAALGWEATRPGRTWLAGPVAALVLTPFIMLASIFEMERLGYLVAVAAASWLYVGVARRLPRERAILWDTAGALLAVLPPVLAWNHWRTSVGLFASAVLLLLALARAHRSPLPLYPAVLAVDLMYVKLLDLIGSPDSPDWLLGVALWPLALAWAAGGCFAQRRWSWPFWLAALGTAAVSAILTVERQPLSSAITVSFALVTILATWRLAYPPLLVLAAPWALIAGWQGAGWLGLDQAARATMMGLAGWLFAGAALLRLPRPATREANAYSWAAWAWATAATTMLIAALLASADFSDTDAWRTHVGLAWADLALALALAAWLRRSRDLAAVASLTLVPALLAAIGLTHPSDIQAYAVPAGLYLLVVASLIRRDRRAGRPEAASVVAGVGIAALVLTSFTQSLDSERLSYALWGLAEGLLLVGLGIALRWRVMVIGGAAGVVLTAVLQLFDALAALPGWVILGSSGIVLLGLAVVLLLVRDRLARTGRLVAERWAGWD